MNAGDLSGIYRGYIACLNRQDWDNLGMFVHDKVRHNERDLGLSGYREMLENDFKSIPDLKFNIAQLVSEPPFIASRLAFDCTPVEALFGLPVNGRRVQFTENVFYRFEEAKIIDVHSVIDIAAIAGQLA